MKRYCLAFWKAWVKLILNLSRRGGHFGSRKEPYFFFNGCPWRQDAAFLSPPPHGMPVSLVGWRLVLVISFYCWGFRGDRNCAWQPCRWIKRWRCFKQEQSWACWCGDCISRGAERKDQGYREFLTGVKVPLGVVANVSISRTRETEAGGS